MDQNIMIQSTDITLSVGIATFNHAKFIGRVIDSILAQKVNFKYEIIISDDGSQDGTSEILKQYKSRHPDVINLYVAEKNAGILKNAYTLYQNCKGQYITWLDGDDYWINENKLQAQIDLLNNHPEYAGCFHDAFIESSVLTEAENNIQIKTQAHNEYKYYSQFNHYKKEFDAGDLIKRNIIPTASLVFRNGDFSDFFNSWAKAPYSLNWHIHLYLIRNNKFYYFNEAWSVYSDHAKGISKTVSANTFKQENVNILKRLLKDPYFRKNHKISIYRSQVNELKQILYHAATYQSGPGFFIKTIFHLNKAQTRLWCLETIYFTGRLIKKK